MYAKSSAAVGEYCMGAFMLTDIYSTADIVRQHIMSKIATQSANITALEEWSC